MAFSPPVQMWPPRLVSRWSRCGHDSSSVGRTEPMPSLVVGRDLAPQTYRITRADLVRYAGASGDFNPIHWNDRTAEAVGLPGVIAHGMLTMALAGRAVTA